MLASAFGKTGRASMSTVIKNGTIVTHDLTYKADILIEDGKIAEIGKDLKGDQELDATGCYVMPGGIDPHTHLEMPFMGTYSSDDFESGTRAALSGGTTMVVDFALPAPGQGLLDAIKMWDNKSTRAHCDYSFHMAVTWWGQQVFDEMKDVTERGINTFKHFMAYKGALMVNDDEMFASFRRCAELGAMPLVHAENGDIVADLQARLMAEGNNGPEGHAYSRPPEVEGEAANRAIMIADMAGVPLYVVHVSCEEAHEAIRRARRKGNAGLGRAADPASDARRKRVFRQGLGPCRAPGDVAAVPQQEAPGEPVGGASGGLAVGGGDGPLRLYDRTETPWGRRFHQDPERHRAGWRTGCRCSGPMAWRRAG
jgi:D-hydantoinase